MKKHDIVYDKDDRKVSQEQFEEISDNIYEAVMVLGQRMRQIERRNSKEFETIRNTLLDDRAEKEYNKEYFAEVIEEDLPVFPKSIRVCMNEMLDGELKYEYEDITKIED